LEERLIENFGHFFQLEKLFIKKIDHFFQLEVHSIKSNRPFYLPPTTLTQEPKPKNSSKTHSILENFLKKGKIFRPK